MVRCRSFAPPCGSVRFGRFGVKAEAFAQSGDGVGEAGELIQIEVVDLLAAQSGGTQFAGQDLQFGQFENTRARQRILGGSADGAAVLMDLEFDRLTGAASAINTRVSAAIRARIA